MQLASSVVISVILTGGIDLAIPGSSGRSSLRILSLSSNQVDFGPLPTFKNGLGMMTFYNLGLYSFQFREYGQLVQLDWYVKGTAGNIVNFISTEY